MKYTWTCEAKTLIEVLQKRNFKKIGHDLNEYDFGTYYFSTTDKLEDLNDHNLIILKRKPTHTMVEFPQGFDKAEIEQIHEETTKEIKSLGFHPHWAILIWNQKKNEYKFLCLQPMFVMGILIQLGVFDYSHVISKLKFNKKDSKEAKYKKFFEYLKNKKFTTESQLSPEFNITDSKGSIKYQVEQHYGQDWEFIGPEKQFAKFEQEFYDNWNYMDALLNKATVIFGHQVYDQEKIALNTFDYCNSKKLYKEFQEYFKQQKKKDKNLKQFECLRKFEQKIDFNVPLFVLNDWEEWEKQEKGNK